MCQSLSVQTARKTALSYFPAMFVNRFQMTGCFLPDIHTHILLRLFNILQGGIMLQYRSYEQNKES